MNEIEKVENAEFQDIEIKTDLSKITNEMVVNLETAERVMDITKEYLKLELKKPKRLLFAGTSEFLDNETGELLKAINFIDSKKRMYLTASTVIYNACKDLPNFSAIEIEYIGDKDLSKGRTMKRYRVTLLNS